VEVRLEAGVTAIATATRHFAQIDGHPPAPAGAFSVAFEVPASVDLDDLWLVVRAEVDGQPVGELRVAADGRTHSARGSTLVGARRLEIDALFWSGRRALAATPIAGTTRAGGLGGFGWLTDPSAR
jgi:hypothetical protein